MGVGFGYVCKKCRMHKNIFYGVGFLGYKEYYMDNNFSELIHLGEEEKLKNVEKLKEFIKLKNVDIKEGYGFDEYICTKCKIIDNKFRYVLCSDKKRFIPKYSCKYCGGDLRIKKMDDELKLKCDYCGSEEFEKRHFMINWD